MSCILCLVESSDHIVLLSPEGITQQIELLMKKYMNFEQFVTTDKHSYICIQCWQAITAFHEFYTRIESIHNILKDSKIECDEPIESEKIQPIDYVYIKEEHHEDSDSINYEEKNPLTYDSQAKAHNTTDTNIAVIKKTACRKSTRKSVPMKLTPINVEKLISKERIITNEMITSVDNVDKISTKNNENVTNKKNDNITNMFNVCEASHLNTSELESNYDINLVHKDKTTKACKKADKVDDFINANFTLTCSLCTVQCRTFALLKGHFRKTHNCQGYVLCCEKKFPKRCLLVDHINVHKNSDYFKCDDCKKSFASRYCLEIHSRVHKSRPRIYKCNNCSKSFFSQPVYMRHMHLHATDEEKKFSCAECGERFFSKYNMEQHLKCVHTDLHVQVCEHCGKSIRGLGTLRQHMELHIYKNSPIQCKECGIKVTTKYGLTRHIRKIHSIENNQKTTCDICFKVSPSISAHKYHMDYMHKAKRKHICNICDKAFKRAITLKEHMTTHNGGTLYTCSHCPKTFNSRANMYSHRKKVHREEWEQMHLEKSNQSSVINKQI
ncbi:zinc finger protein 2 homolog [Teleopsis dalmanni]|uniref:zinc finger protein 2 homolog n=1 Tax=Teleopsis dalmanni TaxID=139649 RepID=UPI000D329980|nr:zinc finger protein 2 homolog [Teleopsis dalmanni]